jgi:hypothetical protein
MVDALELASVTIEEVRKRVNAAREGKDWRGVIKWQGRLENLLEGQSDAAHNAILLQFKRAHVVAQRSTGGTHHALAIVRLEDRRIELLGIMERFRDQGNAMCEAAEFLVVVGNRHESAAYLQRARDVGAAHGFFSVECRACLGLGKSAIREGRTAEGVDLLRNALAASSLRENENDNVMEFQVLARLIDVLFRIHEIEELEPLVLRYREAAEVDSRKMGRVCYREMSSLYVSARLHEVGNPFTPLLPCFRHGR